MGRKRKFNDKEKWCPACEAWVLLDLFGNLRGSPSGKTTYCRSCKADKAEESRKTGEHKTNASRYMRKWHYGISEDEYQKRLREQDYRCALCKRRKRLCVDHNHETNEFRGLLCIACNALLGHFEKNPDLLWLIARYLGIIDRVTP